MRMTLYETVKSNVTTLQAAERYGLKVGHGGMCKCPFHNDKNPSMKVDKRFHCFGCQADGDVIRSLKYGFTELMQQYTSGSRKLHSSPSCA